MTLDPKLLDSGSGYIHQGTHGGRHSILGMALAWSLDTFKISERVSWNWKVSERVSWNSTGPTGAAAAPNFWKIQNMKKQKTPKSNKMKF